MDRAVVIETLEDSQVNDVLDAQLRELFCTCFPKDACFATQRHWRVPPMRRWFMRDGESRLAAHVCIHNLQVGSQAGDLHIGGVAEVCVRSEFRGQGLVRRILADAHAWMVRNNYDFAMLFGATEVYSSSGYANISNVLRSTDWPGGNQIIEAPSKSAMICPLGGKSWPSGLIDLGGPIF